LGQGRAQEKEIAITTKYMYIFMGSLLMKDELNI